jgi:hypothetical protein
MFMATPVLPFEFCTVPPVILTVLLLALFPGMAIPPKTCPPIVPVVTFTVLLEFESEGKSEFGIFGMFGLYAGVELKYVVGLPVITCACTVKGLTTKAQRTQKNRKEDNNVGGLTLRMKWREKSGVHHEPSVRLDTRIEEEGRNTNNRCVWNYQYRRATSSGDENPAGRTANGGVLAETCGLLPLCGTSCNVQIPVIPAKAGI